MPAHNRPTQKTLTEKHAVELSRNNRTTQPEPHKPQPRTRPEQPTKKQATRNTTSHHRPAAAQSILGNRPVEVKSTPAPGTDTVGRTEFGCRCRPPTPPEPMTHGRRSSGRTAPARRVSGKTASRGARENDTLEHGTVQVHGSWTSEGIRRALSGHDEAPNGALAAAHQDVPADEQVVLVQARVDVGDPPVVQIGAALGDGPAGGGPSSLALAGRR